MTGAEVVELAYPIAFGVAGLLASVWVVARLWRIARRVLW